MAGPNDSAPAVDLTRETAGAIAWWREAGVDLTFDDEPARWISPAQPTAREAERLRAELREAAPAIVGTPGIVETKARGATSAAMPRADAVDLSRFPASAEQFAAWWLSEPSLDEGRTGRRTPPRGTPGAPLLDAPLPHGALMVLVPEPEPGDDDRLLAGPQGRLLAAILAATGIGEDEVYVASALCRHTPMPDWADLGARGFGEVLARHVALIAPRRLVAFGDGVLSLLDTNLTHNPVDSLVFTHGDLRVPLLAARSLDALLARPAWKASLWRQLLDWMPGDERGGPGSG